jgi:hypothetical protein
VGDDYRLYIDLVMFGIALVGATLGILNFFVERSRTRVRPKVTPKLCHLMGADLWLAGTKPESKFQAKIGAAYRPQRWAIEVVNLSEFPVSISQVGFGRPKGNPSGDRCVIIAPEVSNGQKMPVRLESRQAATFYSSIGQQLSGRAVSNPKAWVETDCGVTRTGTSPILKWEAARQKSRRNDDCESAS